MQIELKNALKHFKSEVVFRKMNYSFLSPNAYVILGGNGSGKSTLLQILCGLQSINKGELKWQMNGNSINTDEIYRHISICTPYMELPEEFTARQLFEFHCGFKKLIDNIDYLTFKEIIEMKNMEDKSIKNYSSGMKQRLKLALAILSDTSLLCLDEPISNLDANGIKWYQNLVEKYRKDRLIVVCSNHQKEEYFFCNESLITQDYK